MEYILPRTRSHISFLSLLVLGALAFTPIGGQDQQTIAVLEFDGFGVSTQEVAALTNRLRTNLTQLGTYQLIERGRMEQILMEQDFQMTGCTSDECAVEIGQLLGAELMLAGSIGKVGNTWTIEMRIVDVETGAIVRTASYDTRSEVDVVLTEGMRDAAIRIAGVKWAEEGNAGRDHTDLREGDQVFDSTLEITEVGFTHDAEFDVMVRNLGDTDCIIHRISIKKISAPGDVAMPMLQPTAKYHIPVGDIPLGGSKSISVSHVVPARKADRFLIALETTTVYILELTLHYNRNQEVSFTRRIW